MNAITEAPVARQSLTSQTGFATIDTEKAALSGRDRRWHGKSTVRRVVRSPVGSCASSQPCHGRPRRTPKAQGYSSVATRRRPALGCPRISRPPEPAMSLRQVFPSAPRIKYMPRGLIIARGMRTMSDPTPIERRYYRGPRLICLASASLIGGDRLCGNLRQR